MCRTRISRCALISYSRLCAKHFSREPPLEKVFSVFHMEWLCDMYLFVGLSIMVWDLAPLRDETSEVTWKMVIQAKKQCLNLSFISLAKSDLMDKEIVTMQLFADRMALFVKSTCSIALQGSQIVTHMPLHDLPRFVSSVMNQWEWPWAVRTG